MADSEDEPTFLRPRDFFHSPQESKIFEEAKSRASEAGEQDTLDETRLRSQEDWSYLANRVVGAEFDRFPDTHPHGGDL